MYFILGLNTGKLVNTVNHLLFARKKYSQGLQEPRSCDYFYKLVLEGIHEPDYLWSTGNKSWFNNSNHDGFHFTMFAIYHLPVKLHLLWILALVFKNGLMLILWLLCHFLQSKIKTIACLILKKLNFNTVEIKQLTVYIEWIKKNLAINNFNFSSKWWKAF